MTNVIWITEGPQDVVEGSELNMSVTWLGNVTLTGTPVVTVYKNRSLYTSEAIPSGSPTLNTPVISLPKIHFLDGDGGSTYVIVVEAVVDGNTEPKKMQFNVIKDETAIGD